MTKKRSKNKKNKHQRSRRKSEGNTNSTWVDSVVYNNLEDETLIKDELQKISENRFGVISWNVLAESYASPTSHRHLPKRYQNVVFDPKKRREVLKSVLSKLVEEGDIICLQEVDLHDQVETILKEAEFKGIRTPTIKGGRGVGRVDSCCTYWNHQKWELLDQELIRFDDLATLTESNRQEKSGQGQQKNEKRKVELMTCSLDSNLQGFTVSFLRRNMGIMVKLRHRMDPSKIIVVANAHLFWNPLYDYVKLCQAHYLVKRCKNFAGDEENYPVILCGDLNSKPYGPVHTYLTQGRINAKIYAPWYNNQDQRESKLSNNMEEEKSTDDILKATELVQGLILENMSSVLKTKYMLDFTLNKLCCWLRILGIDAVLETYGEEIERTQKENPVILDRCRQECRTLITISSKLLERKDCPPGAYLVNSKNHTHLEVALVHLIKSHGIILEPKTFLISSQVKDQATKLFIMCLRAGIPFQGPLHLFDFVNVEEERSRALELNVNLESSFQIVHWLQQIDLKCPLQLESSYAMRDKNSSLIGECKPFTNVTHNFVGFLDYVFFDKQQLKLESRLHLPGSFSELNEKHEINGHVLPSDIWPSDHLAVGARFSYQIEGKVEEEDILNSDFMGGITQEDAFKMMQQLTKPRPHPTKCQCGCVPPVLHSLKWQREERQEKLKLKYSAN